MRAKILRRRVAAAACVALVAVLAGVLLSGSGGETQRGQRAHAEATPEPPPELPGGGRQIFPRYRVVGFYGNPADDQLGILGIGSPALAGRRLLRQARAYEQPDRPVLPVMELLAVVANADAGDDGLYRRRERHAVIRRYLRAARRIGGLLLLDIQPGRANFMDEARRLERWLREPDVGLALDPEWHVEAPDVPGQVIGTVTGEEVLEVATWLDELTERHDLPQKLFVIHQFTEDMIQGKEMLRPKRNLATVLNADGFGTQPNKVSKYRYFSRMLPWTFDGFKLFYEEDGADLMTPRRVLRLRPSPDVIVYE